MAMVVRVAVIVAVMRMGVAVVRVRMAVMIVLVMPGLDPGRDRHFGLRLRVELAADEQHQRSAEQRKQRYQPDVIEKVHVTTSGGRSGPPGPSLYCGTTQ